LIPIYIKNLGRVAAGMILAGAFKARIEACNKGLVASVTAEFNRR
jgi:hypothetical protein